MASCSRLTLDLPNLLLLLLLLFFGRGDLTFLRFDDLVITVESGLKVFDDVDEIGFDFSLHALETSLSFFCPSRNAIASSDPSGTWLCSLNKKNYINAKSLFSKN